MRLIPATARSPIVSVPGADSPSPSAVKICFALSPVEKPCQPADSKQGPPFEIPEGVHRAGDAEARIREDVQACCGPFRRFATAIPTPTGVPKSLNFKASLNSPRLKRISLLCNGRLRNKLRRSSTEAGIGAARPRRGRTRRVNDLKYIPDRTKCSWGSVVRVSKVVGWRRIE